MTCAAGLERDLSGYSLPDQRAVTTIDAFCGGKSERRPIHQPGGDGNIAVQQAFRMQIDLFAMHPDIGHDPAGRPPVPDTPKISLRGQPPR